MLDQEPHSLPQHFMIVDEENLRPVRLGSLLNATARFLAGRSGSHGIPFDEMRPLERRAGFITACLDSRILPRRRGRGTESRGK